MTTYQSISVRCARCGTQSEHDQLASMSSSGYPDLDGRPSWRVSATMSAWLQECPNCLYVARDISSASAEEADVVREIGFIEAGLSEAMPDLAIRFMRRAYIDEQTGQRAEAIRRLLHAAWVLDDFNLDAASVRTRAADMIRALGDDANISQRLLRLDLLRRTKAFTEVIAEADRLLGRQLESDHRKIVIAQRWAAFERQSAALSLSVALHPPVRRGRLRVVTFPRA